MTREHKLALILGFAVVLIVGVLFADHFSKARTTRVDDQTALQTPDPVPAAAPSAVNTPSMQLVAGNGGRSPTDAPLPPAFEPVASYAPGEITMGSPSGTEADLPTNSTGTRLPDSGLIGGLEYPPRRNGPIPAANTETTPIGGSSNLATSFTDMPVPAGPTVDVTKSASQPTPGLPVSKGVETRYPVEAGDTLIKIAKRVYGDGGLWKQLGQYNKDKVRPDGSNLREGVTLRVPPKDVLLGAAVLAPGGKSTGIAKPDPDQPTKIAAKPAPRTYTIKPGDTFSKIAAAELGSVARWNEIAKLNPSFDSSDLRIGDALKLPAK
ncbi:MAG: LysM peptidoglycan-binding domain-containing protein [Phycisphaerales bacterium]